jgi:hypothetical protein
MSFTQCTLDIPYVEVVPLYATSICLARQHAVQHIRITHHTEMLLFRSLYIADCPQTAVNVAYALSRLCRVYVHSANDYVLAVICVSVHYESLQRIVYIHMLA